MSRQTRQGELISENMLAGVWICVLTDTYMPFVTDGSILKVITLENNESRDIKSSESCD